MKHFLITLLLVFSLCGIANAAVTVSVSGTARNVDTSADTDDMDDVYDAFYTLAGGAETYMTRTGGAGSYVYTVAGNAVLWIKGTSYVTLQTGCTLQWTLTTTMNPVIDVGAYATFKIEPSCTLDYDTNGTHYTIARFYGKTIFEGGSGTEITIQHFYTQYINFYQVHNGTSHQWDYVNLVTPSTYNGNGNFLQFNGPSDTQIFNSYFKHITIDGNVGGTRYGRAMYYQVTNLHDVEFSDWDISGVNYILLAGGGSVKFVDSSFSDNYYYFQTRSCDVPRPIYNQTIPSQTAKTSICSQIKNSFIRCTFTNNYQATGNKRGFFGVTNVPTYFEDCEFEGYYGILAGYSTIVLFGGTQTFTSTTVDYALSSNGVVNHTYKLALTVEDSGGSPIEDATVMVRQKEGNEFHLFVTDSNGQIKDLFGDDPIFTYQQEYIVGTFDIWSDGTGNQVHIIEVFKTGYTGHTEEIAFDQDRTKTITLQTGGGETTVLYDSTIYGSTFY